MNTLPVKSPTAREMKQARDILQRYSLAHPYAAAPKDEKERQKRAALAMECEQIHNELFKRVMDAVQDEGTRDLIATMSMIQHAYLKLNGRETPSKKSRDLFAWEIARARKLLKK